MPARKGLRVTAPVIIEMTAAQVNGWAEEYGVADDEMTPGQVLDAVREDIGRYVLNLVQECAGADYWTATAKAQPQVSRRTYNHVSPDLAAVILGMRGQPVRAIAQETGVPKATVQRILTEGEESQRRRQGYAG